MRTDAQRVAAYVAKYAPTQVGLKIAAMLTGMKSSYASVANDIQPIETAITAVLTSSSIPTPFWGSYLAYGRELWRRKKLGGDPALTVDAQRIKDKWTSRLLTGAVLIQIAGDVFTITVT